ncbi:Prolyl oligopeptidase family protein [Nonomuraea jiangxiensis]|uniref:Prolyl oligopeptidase family protein n=2 Tax=Nonomuraea jiangxiensis TaxID=633440 RepID=A0A1G9R9F7_9ACTN|nr:Prolyl oligopeptidase family protein [Nonomuraea jiangxiensis]
MVAGPGVVVDPGLLAEVAEREFAALGVRGELVHARDMAHLRSLVTGGAVVLPGPSAEARDLIGQPLGPVIWVDIERADGVTAGEGATHLHGRGVSGVAWGIRHAVHRRRHPSRRVAYGPSPEQWGDLYVPAGAAPAPVVALIHGGYWRSIWAADIMEPLCADLLGRGLAVWNLEYRRPDLHGWQATTTDVATGLATLATLAFTDPPALDPLTPQDTPTIDPSSASGTSQDAPALGPLTPRDLATGSAVPPVRDANADGATGLGRGEDAGQDAASGLGGGAGRGAASGRGEGAGRGAAEGREVGRGRGAGGVAAAVVGGSVLDLSRVAVVGHSAGAQLALRAVADGVRVALVVSLAGVLDLVEGDRRWLSSGAVPAALGHRSTQEPGVYADASPLLRVPLGAPQLIVQGADDDLDLVDFSRRYARAAQQAGDKAKYLEMPGDHFAVITPATPIWQATAQAIATALR